MSHAACPRIWSGAVVNERQPNPVAIPFAISLALTTTRVHTGRAWGYRLSRHASFSIAWPTSCRLREGIATATMGCLRHITRSGPPSRRWRSGISASGPTLHRLSLSLGERAGVSVPPMPRPAPTTPPDARGEAHRTDRRRLPARVPSLWWRYPPHRLHDRPGADPEDPRDSRRAARAATARAGARPADRLGRARAGRDAIQTSPDDLPVIDIQSL
jgi:hypothetical protein